MNLTDFLLMDTNGDEIEAHAFGPRLAFTCWVCGHPVLASALDNEPGSDGEHPTGCKGCGIQYVLDVRWHAEKLYIHNLADLQEG